MPNTQDNNVENKTPDQLFAALDALGIAHQTVKHPPLFTVEQSQALRGQIPGGHTKNLFLLDKKHELFLVVAEEDAEIDLKGLAQVIAFMGEAGELTAPLPPVERFVDLQFLKAAGVN